MKLRERLIFGTSRLAGGGCARDSRRLLEICISAGIAAFDTAPSYGMGAAEALLGEVAGGIAGLRLHTKVGSIRPAHPALLGWGKWFRGKLKPGRKGGEPRLLPYAGPAAGCDYDPAAMRASLDRSLDALRRERADLLLMHEAEPADLPAASRQFLSETLAADRAAAIGFAHFGPIRHEAGVLTAQVAPWPADFLKGGEGGRRIFHSVRNASRFAMAHDRESAVALERCAARNSGIFAGSDAAFLAALVVLARAWPGAELIFATTDPARLRGFLQAVDRIDETALARPDAPDGEAG